MKLNKLWDHSSTIKSENSQSQHGAYQHQQTLKSSVTVSKSETKSKSIEPRKKLELKVKALNFRFHRLSNQVANEEYYLCSLCLKHCSTSTGMYRHLKRHEVTVKEEKKFNCIGIRCTLIDIMPLCLVDHL